MNFRILNGDIDFSSKFVKLNEIRERFLQEAFKSVDTFKNECINRFNDLDQLKKDGETFGYNYLNNYIKIAVNIIKEFEISDIDNDTFFKEYYFNKYCTWGKTLDEIKNKHDEDSNENLILSKLNINSDLIKTPFEIKEKDIETDNENNRCTIPKKILDKLINSMIESIFNINFAIIDFLNDNNVDSVDKYSETEDIKKSNELIKALLKDEIPNDEETNTIEEIIKLNPYNENIYKALLYKYGDEENQIEHLGEFLGYNNIHEYKHKLLDEYYATLSIDTNEDIIKAKESIKNFANKMNINDYEKYINEIDKILEDNNTFNKDIESKEIENNPKMATVELDKEIKTPKSKVKKNSDKGLIIAASILACILGVYLLMALYFNSHFFFRTSINSVSISGKSNKSAQELMANKANEYVLTLEERNDKTETISGEAINLKYDFTEAINNILDEQNPFLWIASIFQHKNYDVSEGVSYDESLLNQAIGNLEALNESNVTNPVNASLNYANGEYEIVKEDIGNKVKIDKLNSKIFNNIQNVNSILNLDDEGCYENPTYTSKSKAVTKAKKTADKYVNAKVTLNINESSEVIDGSMINQWITIDDDFNVSLNEDSIREYVNQLGDKYDNIGSTRTFTRWSGETIKISTTPGIYYLDRDTAIADITSAIEGGGTDTKELTFKTPKATDEYVLNTFVEVDLTNQTVIYYKNGEVITQGDVVTGNVSQGHSTPAGVYKLDWKAKDYVLRGDGYASPVSFWMPFNGGIGLHDASWRSSFGGSIYKTNGSHGCVNMPYSVAKAIYENIEDYTTIICRY